MAQVTETEILNKYNENPYPGLDLTIKNGNSEEIANCISHIKWLGLPCSFRVDLERNVVFVYIWKDLATRWKTIENDVISSFEKVNIKVTPKDDDGRYSVPYFWNDNKSPECIVDLIHLFATIFEEHMVKLNKTAPTVLNTRTNNKKKTAPKLPTNSIEEEVRKWAVVQNKTKKLPPKEARERMEEITKELQEKNITSVVDVNNELANITF